MARPGVRVTLGFNNSRYGQEIFFLLHNIQTGFGAHLLSHSVGCSLGAKWLKHAADHSPPFTADNKNGGAIPYFYSPKVAIGLLRVVLN
jgi:hypothetical protein